MWKESIRPFTVLCLWAVAVACANLNERGGAAAGTEAGKASASAVQVRELQGGAAASEKKTAAPASRQRIIIRDRAPQEPLHRTFDREREEQYEEEEEHRGRSRHRDE